MSEKVKQELQELRKTLQQKERELIQKIRVEVHELRNKLNQKELELKELEAKDEKENRAKKRNFEALLLQKKADQKMLSSAEEYKRDREALWTKIIDLESKHISSKHSNGIYTLPVVREVFETVNGLQQKLEQKEQQSQWYMKLYDDLLVKENKIAEELREARRELMNIFDAQSAETIIGVKIVGELSSRAFLPAAKRMCTVDKAEVRAAEICKKWNTFLRDISWKPFKTNSVGGGQPTKKILDEEDPRLKELSELGEEAYRAVTTALMEMNEYSPTYPWPVGMLWNYKEERQATLKEGIVRLRALLRD